MSGARQLLTPSALASTLGVIDANTLFRPVDQAC